MLFFGVFLHESARTAAKSQTNLSTNSGKATERLGWLAPNLAHMCKFIWGWRYAKLPLETQGGTWGGGLGGQQFKSLRKLSNCHQLWFTSGDSSGNGHRLNTSRPSIPQVAFRGGGGRVSQIKKFGEAVKRLDILPQIWHTSADPASGNRYTPNKLPLETQGRHLGGFRGQTFKILGKLSNGWTDWHQLWFTRLRIHLGMDTG